MGLEKATGKYDLPEVATAQELLDLGAFQEDASQIVYKENGVLVCWQREFFNSENYVQRYSGFAHPDSRIMHS